MKDQTTFTGIATVTEFAGKPILISAGDIDTLKQYLGQQGAPGHPECCNVSITVGPRAELVLPTMAGLLAARQFAARITGRQVGSEITGEEEREAKKLGLVVVFGYSDDCTEFRGMIHDEAGTGKLTLTTKAKLMDAEQMEALDSLIADGTLDKGDIPHLHTIMSRYGDDGWTFETIITHAKFVVMEDGEQFCEGIVFHISDLTN